MQSVMAHKLVCNLLITFFTFFGMNSIYLFLLSVYNTPVTILLKNNTILGKNLCVKGLNEVKKLKGFIFLVYSDQVR